MHLECSALINLLCRRRPGVQRPAASPAAVAPRAPARAHLRAAPLQRSSVPAKPAQATFSGPAHRSLRLATRAAAAAAAAAAAPGSSPPAAEGLWARFSRLAAALTNLFPVFVLGAAVWALRQPSAFSWFDTNAITPALAVTMLGMGLTLTFEVGTVLLLSFSACPHPHLSSCCCLHTVSVGSRSDRRKNTF
jgi:hypothetical protein